MKADPSVAEAYPELYDMVNLYDMGSQSISWDNTIGPHLLLVKVGPGQLVWEMEVKDHHCNQLGNLHGGCVATLIDVCTSFATLVHEKGKKEWRSMGVSTDLSISYFLGVPAGETIRIECNVQRVGKNLANMTSTIYNSSGKACYSGSHTKFRIDSQANLSKM